MKLNNEALKKQIKNQNSGVTGGLKTATNEIKEAAHRQAAAGMGPMSIGNYIEDASNISENSDYAQAKRAQRTYLNPGMYAALSIAATVIAADDVGQAEKDLEYLKTARHHEPVKNEHGEIIKNDDGSVKMRDSDTSIYEYQTRGIRDKDANYELMRDSGGKVSHTETTPMGGKQDVWGPSDDAAPIQFTSDRPENIDMPSVNSRFAHYMDKSTDHGTNTWQEQLGVRMVNASEIKDMDGGHAADFFSDAGMEKGSPFEDAGDATGAGLAENADIPELGEGTGKVKVLDMRLSYQQVKSEDTPDLSTGKQIDYSSVRTNSDGVKTVILSDGSEKRLDQIPVHNGRYIDPTTCTGSVTVSANNLGEKIGTMQDGTRIQLTVLDKASKCALFGEASDGFMMEHAGSNRADYVGIHHVSFLKEEKDSEGFSSGVLGGFENRNFKQFIKNGRVDTAAADAAGFNVALTVAKINGKEVVTGASFIKRNTGIKTGIFSRGTARQVNDNVRTGMLYEEAILGKESMMPAAVFKRIKAKKGLDQEQKEFLDKGVKSQKRASDSLKTRKRMLRQLKTSLIRMTILTPMAEDQDMQRGYQLTRKYYNGIILAMRLERQVGFIRKPTKLAFKGIGKLVKFDKWLFMKIGPVNKLVTRLKASRFSKGIVNSKIVKAAQRMIQKAIKIGNANGVLAYMSYRTIVGAAGFFMRAPVSIFAAVTKGTKAGNTAKNIARVLKKGTESVLQQGDGIGNFEDLGTVLVGLAGKGTKAAGKGVVKLAKKGGNAAGKKIFKKNWGFVKGGLKKTGSIIAAPFKVVGKAAGFLGRGVSAIRKWIKDILKSLSHCLKVAAMWILLIFLAVILFITLVCYIGAIFSSFLGLGDKIKDFFKLGSTDEKIEQVTPDGQPTVEPLVQILQDEHNDMVSKIIKKRDKIKAQPEIIYDNGSIENYKECISALNVTAGQDYGLYGGNMCRDMMKKIYEKSHVMWVETRVIEHTEPVYEKNDAGRLVEKKDKNGGTVYKTTYETLYYIHLNILRDTAVVSEKDAAAAVPEYDPEASGTSEEDITDTEWLAICAKVKRTCQDQVAIGGDPNHKYAKDNGQNITVDGKQYFMPHHDCSGFVSLCLRVAGIEKNASYSSSSLATKASTKMIENIPWNKSGTQGLKKGDILVYSGHTEVYAGKINGVGKVYNWGGDGSPNSPCIAKGPTNMSSTRVITHVLRIKTSINSEDYDETDNDTESGKKNKNKKNNNTEANKAAGRDPEATLEYDTTSLALTYGEWFRNKKGQRGSYTGSVTYERPTGNKWNYFTSSIGNRKALYSHASQGPGGGLYVTVKDGDIKGLPSGEKLWIVALGGGLFRFPGDSSNAAVIGQVVELKLNDGSSRFCVVGDTKSSGDSTIEVPHHYCHINGSGAGQANFFEVVGYCQKGPNSNPNDNAEMSIYGKVKGAGEYVSKIIVYNKNIVPGNGYFNGSRNGKGGSVTLTSEGVAGAGGAYSVDYDPISYNSRGDEEGAYTEFRKTLDEFVNKSKSGKYKQTTMYDRYHDFDESTQKIKKEKIKWKAKRQHTLTDKGGMGTGLDFLRCVIYSKHGASIPWEYKVLKSRQQEHYTVKTTKKGTEYKVWDTIKVGDLIIYQPDMNKPLYNWNTIVFSYYGGPNKYVVGYLNEDCDFGSAGDVVKIPYSDLKKTHIYKVIRINGLTKEKRYLAYPKVGFGGFKDKNDLKHMNVDVNGEKSDNDEEIEYSDVELFKDMIDNKKLWVKKDDKDKTGLVIYPNAKYESYDDNGSKSGTQGVSLYYYGYTEDDFKDLLAVTIDYKDQKDVLDEMVSKMGAGFDSLKAHGYLPSTFMTLAWYYSSQGTDSILMALNNPVGLKKWWKDTDNNIYPYSSYSVDGSGYLRFNSMDDCVTAWMYYVQDKTSSHSYDQSGLKMQLFGQGEGSPSLLRLKNRSSAQYLSASENTDVKPYKEALRQYLAVVEGYSVYGDDNNAVLDELITICEDYDIYYYDTGIGDYDPNSDANQKKTEEGNKPQADSEKASADKNDAENLVYTNSGNAKLDCNGDGKIDLNDMSPDMLDEAFNNNMDNGGLIAQMKAIYGDAFDDGGKTKRSDYTGTKGGTMDLSTLNSYLDWKKNGRDSSMLPTTISDKRVSYN